MTGRNFAPVSAVTVVFQDLEERPVDETVAADWAIEHKSSKYLIFAMTEKRTWLSVRDGVNPHYVVTQYRS